MVDDRALRFRRRTPAGEPPNQTRTDSRLDAMLRGYMRNQREGAKQEAVLNPLNPFPSVIESVMEGRKPTKTDVGMDVGFLAAGLIPFGKAAKPVARTVDNRAFVNAINEYLQRPLTAYQSTQNPALLQRGFAETAERIPAGTQMYRAPSAGQVMPRRGSQSVPLPREVGAEYLPGRVQSTGGSSDMNKLGELLKDSSTGGAQEYAPAMAVIEAMEDLPGIYNLNDFLSKYGVDNQRNFITESVLGPQTRYVVRDFNPSGSGGFPTWYLQAYAR